MQLPREAGRDCPQSFDVPELGKVTLDERLGWYAGTPTYVPILGADCRFLLVGYAEDEGKADFHAAIANFLRLDTTAFRVADEALLHYYKDNETWWLRRGEPVLRTAAQAWSRVTLGRQPMVSRREKGDRAIYISVESECAWEEEHGLELVFRNGLSLSKLGSYDGHATNSEAYGDERLEGVIYHSPR